MDDDPRVRLITGAIAGQPLSRFMPGTESKSAIHAVVATWKTWVSDIGYAEVRAGGVGLWPAIRGDHEPGDATVFLTWPQILEIIARGCAGAGGRRTRPPGRRTTTRTTPRTGMRGGQPTTPSTPPHWS